NEDLIRAHIQAIWLAETKQNLHSSVGELLLLKDLPDLPLLAGLRESMDSASVRAAARERASRVMAQLERDVGDAPWYNEHWLDDVVSGAFQNFDLACDRWRRLYAAAEEQAERQ